VVAPAATVTDAGTVSKGLLLASETTIPPTGAAEFSVVEQVEIWPPVKLPRTHVNMEREGGIATMPPTVVNAGSAEPVGSTPTGFDTLIDVVVAFAANVSWTLATIPAAIAFVFGPDSKQLIKPGAEAQESVFPAATDAGPAVTPKAEI
jgi:hypothetical protein